MAKFNLIKLLIAVLVFATPLTISAGEKESEYTKKELKEFDKAAKKDAKKQVKRQNKEKWVYNGSGDLERKVYNHLKKLVDYGGKCEELIGNAQNIRSVSLAGTSARMDAITTYAENSGLAIKARIEGMDSKINEEQTERLIRAYEAKLAKELNGELRQSYEVYRQNKDGNYDVNVYYLIDEETAKKAKIRALKSEAEIQKLELEIADEISKFVNEE